MLHDSTSVRNLKQPNSSERRTEWRSPGPGGRRMGGRANDRVEAFSHSGRGNPRAPLCTQRLRTTTPCRTPNNLLRAQISLQVFSPRCILKSGWCSICFLFPLSHSGVQEWLGVPHVVFLKICRCCCLLSLFLKHTIWPASSQPMSKFSNQDRLAQPFCFPSFGGQIPSR